MAAISRTTSEDTSSGVSASPAPAASNPSLLMDVFQRIFEEPELKSAVSIVFDSLDSAPAANFARICLKSAPYAYFSDHEWAQYGANGLSCRMSYLESVMLSVCSAVYNLAFSAVFTVLNLVTFFQFQALKDQMRKHWTHTAIATTLVGYSAVGVVSPLAATTIGGGTTALLGIILIKSVSDSLIRGICNAYQRHAAELRAAAMREAAPGQHITITSFLDHLDTHLRAERVADLTELLNTFARASRLLPDRSVASLFNEVMSYVGITQTDAVAR